METQRVIIELPAYVGDNRFKNWAKHLTGIDTQATNGYAYQGAWLQLGRKNELPVGAYILLYGEHGSMKYHAPTVTIARVEADGELTTVLETESDKSWALTLRDQAAALFTAAPDREALEAEAARLRERLAEIEALLQA